MPTMKRTAGYNGKAGRRARPASRARPVGGASPATMLGSMQRGLGNAAFGRLIGGAEHAARLPALIDLQARQGNQFVQRLLVNRDDTPEAPATIDLKVTWSGMYSDDAVNPHDIAANVAVRATKGGAILGEGTGDGSVTLTVTRGKKYFVSIDPTATAPDDRYKTTNKAWKSGSLPSGADLEIGASLAVDRWNLRNVEYVWRKKGIDVAKAGDIKGATLFGKSIRINSLALPKVNDANSLFAAESAETQKEITDSILVIGGYAKRTTSEGTFSNHSLGTAIDMNYNLDTKQNYHFKKKVKADKALLNFVQAIVRRTAGHGTFDIWSATGQAQLEASEIFNQEFPTYLREAMQELTPRPEPAGGAGSATWAESAWEALVEALTAKFVLSEFSKADITSAIAAAKRARKTTLAKQLQLVRSNYDDLKAWLEGAALEGGTVEQEGMIPLNKTLLRIMLEAGWDWGGDWTSAKDYMHFEDLAATTEISSAPVPAAHP